MVPVPQEFQHDVFLGYSAKDKTVVRRGGAIARGQSKSVFDEWEIQPGDSIPSKVEQGISN